MKKIYSFKKINLLLIGEIKIIKNRACYLWLYIIIVFIIIYFCFQIFYQKLITANILDLKNNDKKNSINISQIIDNNFFFVKNAEGEPDTKAKIIKFNKINFIPKVSVIIPVYNMGEFLTKCLKSVIKQTLKEIEIICIDDGSTDNSLDILKHFAEKDNRMTIIRQENLHAGVARNAGLAVAKGKYLSFLDSDDFFELNMLEEMYKKILKKQSDIIICRCKSIDLDTGQFNDKIFNNSLRLDLIPKKSTFSVLDIPKSIFQIFEGWAWDKLFRTEFILSNNIKFQNLINFNDNQFTYTALCFAKSITTIEKRFVIKRHGHKKSLSANRNKDPSCFLLSYEKLKYNLEKFGLYNLVKESFWKWALKLCIIQLKNLDKTSKEYLFNILHQKFNLWDYIDNSPQSSTRYRSLNYIKNHKVFPSINIAYIINYKTFNLFLTSLVSVLKNSEYENINIILFYKDIAQVDLQEINKLKEIRFFFLAIYNASEILFENFSSKEFTIKEKGFNICLLINFLCYHSDIDKILYLSYNTILRKSLLSLWEIDMKNNLIAGVEDISYSKDKAKKLNLKDNIYINDGVLLLNIKEWKKENLCNKILDYNNNNQNNNYESAQDIINIFSDSKKNLLLPEYNYMKIFENNTCQYDYKYLEIYRKNAPTIINFWKIELNTDFSKDLFQNDFLKYHIILNNIKDKHFSIPIVLSSDNRYATFMYTTMLSILESGYKNTYYIFYLLVSSNFSKSIKNIILELNNKYKCYINFIYINSIFENVIMKIPHITLSTFYRLLIGDLLPKEFDKCIYLDTDIIVNKDLSNLFKIDMKDNYLAGVVSPSYYFQEKKHCKRLNLPSMKQYVNAGMLMMNLKQIRKDKMTQKFIELSKRNYDSQDQDVLNVACYGKILTLPPKYNVMILRLKEYKLRLKELYEEEDIIAAINAPYIIHYSNKRKPWNDIGINMEEYWWNVAKKTPFINIIFTRESIYINELKKFWFDKKKTVLDLDRPRYFNEKIQWLKLYDSTPIKTRLSDKYLVREWVIEKIGEEYLIPLIGVFNKFEDIYVEKLPTQFVIKCNHGKGYNIIVKNKSLLNITFAKSKVEKWMEENYAFSNGLELQYRDIKHKIIIEEYIDDGTGDLRDYKFICFNGKPIFLYVDCDKHSNPKRNLYDLNWNQLTHKINSNLSSFFPSLEKPKDFEKMVKLASILSQNFTYVRVGFYIAKNKIYFGEMSFTDSSGIEDISPKSFDRRLSSLIKLPKLAFNIDTGYYYELKKHFSFYPYYFLLVSLLLRLIFNLSKLIHLIFFNIN